MTQVVTELTCRDAYKRLGVCNSIFPPNTSTEIANGTLLVGINLLRVSVLSQGQVNVLKDMLVINPSLKFNLLVLGYTSIPETWETQRPLIAQLVALGCVESIEGPNEENLFPSHGPDTTTKYANPAATKAGTLAWAKIIKAAFPNVTTYGPTLAGNIVGSSAEYASYTPNLVGAVDRLAIHKYPAPGAFMCNDDGQGSLQEGNRGLPWVLNWARAASGVKPAVITETGCPGAIVPQDNVVDLPTQAKVILSSVFDCMALGLERIFLYNLTSGDGADPQNNKGPEYHYGLVDNGAARPAGQSIKRLQDLLYDPVVGHMGDGWTDGSGGAFIDTLNFVNVPAGRPQAKAMAALTRIDQSEQQVNNHAVWRGYEVGQLFMLRVQGRGAGVKCLAMSGATGDLVELTGETQTSPIQPVSKVGTPPPGQGTALWDFEVRCVQTNSTTTTVTLTRWSVSNPASLILSGVPGDVFTWVYTGAALQNSPGGVGVYSNELSFRFNRFYNYVYRNSSSVKQRGIDKPGRNETEVSGVYFFPSRVSSPSTPPFVPKPLSVTISGTNNTASGAGTFLSFRKSDGSDLIVTWNEPVIWNNTSRTAVVPPAVPVTVGWNTPRRYEVIDLLDGSTTHGDGTSVTLPLRGYPMMVRLAAAA